MGKIISVKCFSDPSYSTFSPSVQLGINSDIIDKVIPATAGQIAALGTGVVNQIIVNSLYNNEGQAGAYLVNDSLASIVTASGA